MIKIYTDGSCVGNPGNGGWAAIIIENGKKTRIKGSKKETTNNQMELLAPIKALKKIPKGSKVQIFTDSKYVKSGITEWIHNWKKNGWKTANKKEVKNKELIPLKEDAICKYMKMITREKLYQSLKNNIFEVKVPEKIANKARLSIKRMIEIT